MFSKKKVKIQFDSKGASKSLALEDGQDNIPFDLKIKFAASMPYDGNIEKDAKFKSKKMQFTLLTEGEKKGKELVIGKADIDLAAYCFPGKFEPEQKLELLGKEKKSSARNPALMLEVAVEWLKVNGKKVTSSAPAGKKSMKASKSKSDVAAIDDAFGGLDDLESSGFGSKKNNKFKPKKKPMSEEDLLAAEAGPDSIEVGGQEFTLEEPDPDEMSISEVESNWDGDETDRDYLSEDDEDWKDELAAEGDKAFEEEEAKDKLSSKKSPGLSKKNDKKGDNDDEFGLGGGGGSAFAKRKPDSGGAFARRKPVDDEDENHSDEERKKKEEDLLASDEDDGIGGDLEEDEKPAAKPAAAPTKQPEPEPAFQSSFQRRVPLPGIAKESKEDDSKKEKESPRDSGEKKRDSSKPSKPDEKDKKSSDSKRDSSKKSADLKTPSKATKKSQVSSKANQGEVDDLHERIRILEAKMEARDEIQNYTFNAGWEYDREGLSVPAIKLAGFMTQESRVFDKVSQYDEENQYTLQEVLSAFYNQYNRYPEELSHQLGWLQFGASLVTATLRATPADHFTPEGKGAKDELSPKWCLTWNKTGVITRFNTYKSAQDSMADLDVAAEFADLTHELASPSIAFMQLLDQMISHNYGIACTALRKRLQEANIDDVFFDQDHIASTARKKAKALKKQGRIMHELDTFVSLTRFHKIPKSVEMQMLAQAFSTTTASLVNNLTSTATLCRASSALCVRASLSHMEEWLAKLYVAQKSPQVNSPTDNRSPPPAHIYPWVYSQFEPIRECANLLQIDKSALAVGPTELIGSVFTCLNAAQIAKILQQFKTDEFASESVPDGALRGFQAASSSSRDKVPMDIGFILRVPAPGKL